MDLDLPPSLPLSLSLSLFSLSLSLFSLSLSFLSFSLPSRKFREKRLPHPPESSTKGPPPPRQQLPSGRAAGAAPRAARGAGRGTSRPRPRRGAGRGGAGPGGAALQQPEKTVRTESGWIREESPMDGYRDRCGRGSMRSKNRRARGKRTRRRNTTLDKIASNDHAGELQTTNLTLDAVGHRPRRQPNLCCPTMRHRGGLMPTQPAQSE